jgi:hypothetical protein
MKRGRKRAMRIVPKVVLGSVAVAVVPAVLATACNHEDLGVAVMCFDGSTQPGCVDHGTATTRGDAGATAPTDAAAATDAADATDAPDASDDGDASDAADVGLD